MKTDMFVDIDFGFDESVAIDDSPIDAIADSLHDASYIRTAAQAGLQTASLQSAIDNFAKELNQSAIAKSTGLPSALPTSQYKGFAAEEYFKQTLKISELA
jgi:hypothetical protein